ncbi:MAG: nucleotidyltransferase domain-containing protein [Candidatus Bathyarchaeota archaeon]|nr:nucleotidyltransferase domain-containing protein [Candidatus Bathyarchaeota archaeon]
MQSAYDKIQFYKISPKEKDEIIKKLKKSLVNEKRIQLAIIFGSLTTRNNIRDIDICIHSNPKLKFQELLNLNAQIELDLGMPVDLVELTDLNPTLQINILKNGTIIKGQKTLINKFLSQANTQKSIAID